MPLLLAVSTSRNQQKGLGSERQLPGERRQAGDRAASKPWWRWGTRLRIKVARPTKASSRRRPSPRASTQAMASNGEEPPCSPGPHQPTIIFEQQRQVPWAAANAVQPLPWSPSPRDHNPAATSRAAREHWSRPKAVTKQHNGEGDAGQQGLACFFFFFFFPQEGTLRKEASAGGIKPACASTRQTGSMAHMGRAENHHSRRPSPAGGRRSFHPGRLAKPDLTGASQTNAYLPAAGPGPDGIACQYRQRPNGRAPPHLLMLTGRPPGRATRAMNAMGAAPVQDRRRWPCLPYIRTLKTSPSEQDTAAPAGSAWGQQRLAGRTGRLNHQPCGLGPKGQWYGEHVSELNHG